MVAFIYHSTDTGPRKLEDLLGSIVRQICLKSRDFHAAIWEKWRNYHDEASEDSKVPSQSLGDVCYLLSKVSAGRRIYIVVDAMDELSMPLRMPLMKKLKNIGQGVKILATSRYMEHLKELLCGFTEHKIEAHIEDMEEYIDSMIESHTVLKQFSKQIREVVPQRSGGMYVLSCVPDSLL